VLPLVAERTREVAELCARFKVRRLELFGSAAGPQFGPQRSDLDFLVEFEPLPVGQYADAYFGLREGLAAMFGRQVDLIVSSAVANPYLRESIDRTRALLYAA
jgi:predicted nucleotidyltransferase